MGNNPDVYLPIEAIDQLSIQSNAESDMGRNGGANANIVIKSGSNQFHGTLYEFNRNEALAARSPLLRPGTPKQVIRNNQFGFSVGGPIIPNKTFFFLNGESQRANAAISGLATSPSAAWVTAASGVLQQYNVPVNPVSTNLLNFFPANSRNGPTSSNNFISQAQNQFISYDAVVRVDHYFSDKHSIFLRYIGGDGSQIGAGSSNFYPFFQSIPAHIHNFGVSETDLWSSKLTNQITFGVNYFWMGIDDLDTAFNPLGTGLNTGSKLNGSPYINISGFTTIGNSNGGPLDQPTRWDIWSTIFLIPPDATNSSLERRFGGPITIPNTSPTDAESLRSMDRAGHGRLTSRFPGRSKRWRISWPAIRAIPMAPPSCSATRPGTMPTIRSTGGRTTRFE